MEIKKKVLVKPKKKKIPVSRVEVSLPDSVELKQTSQSSVEIKRNAKGIVEFTVKVYDDDSKKARVEAENTFVQLYKKFKLK